MNAGNRYLIAVILLTAAAVCWPQSVRSLIKDGNGSYLEGYFDKAQEKYESALEKDKKNQAAQYNNANALYKQKKYKEAIELYRDAAASGSRKDISVKSKINLGNSLFMDAVENLADTPDKAIESLEQSVDIWRQVSDILPGNKSVKRNIEVAKLKLRELKQQQQQQQQENQQQNQDPNDVQQDEQKQQDKQNDQQQDQKDQQQDQQQADDDQQNDQQQEQQQQENKDQQDQQQQQQSQQQQQMKEDQEKLQQAQAREQKAEDILEQEKKARQLRMLMRGEYIKVEKDW